MFTCFITRFCILIRVYSWKELKGLLYHNKPFVYVSTLVFEVQHGLLIKLFAGVSFSSFASCAVGSLAFKPSFLLSKMNIMPAVWNLLTLVSWRKIRNCIMYYPNECTFQNQVIDKHIHRFFDKIDFMLYP